MGAVRVRRWLRLQPGGFVGVTDASERRSFQGPLCVKCSTLIKADHQPRTGGTEKRKSAEGPSEAVRRRLCVRFDTRQRGRAPFSPLELNYKTVHDALLYACGYRRVFVRVCVRVCLF